MQKNKLTSAIALSLAIASTQAADFIVQTTGDSGGGLPVLVSPGIYQIDTLRSAVEQADDELLFPGADQIHFDHSLYVGGEATITLVTAGDVYSYIGSDSDSALGINSDIAVIGPADGSTLFISGGQAIRHFQVNDGGHLRVDGVTLTEGLAPANIAGTGGAIVIDGGGALTMVDSVVSNCVAETGGALNFRNNSNTSYISRSLFYGNSTTGNSGSGTGGAIFKRGSNPLYVDASTFTSNTANYSGGGLFTSGNLVVTNSTIHNNFANRGGGGLDTNNIGVLTLVNSTVSGNVANNNGGGVNIGTENDHSLIIQSTITGNWSQYDQMGIEGGGPPLGSSGGGIFAGNVESVELHNTLITDNQETQSQTPDDVAANIRPQSSHNLFTVGDSVLGLSDGVNGNQIGTLATPINAGIQPLADNGGITMTHTVASTSPAINAGDNAVVSSYGLTYDQRGMGYQRVSGIVDVGALESDVIFANGFE